MRSPFNFIVKPKEKRNTSTKKIKDKELILNTELQNHLYVSRHGIVLETPMLEKTNVKKGDEVILHHNVFRRFYDVKGNEKNSKSFFDEEVFFASPDQIFLYKRNKDWKPVKGYCFVKPIKNDDIFSDSKEKPLVGIMKYPDEELIKNGIKSGFKVGFKPRSEYEFIVNGEKLYRVKSNLITIKYEHKGNEVEYNPSWL